MLWSRFFIVSMTLALSACGYHLQSYDKMPAEMGVTYIQASNQYSVFYRELRTALENADIEITDNRERATATLIIDEDNTGQRLVTVSGTNQPLEFEVFYDVRIQVLTADGILLPEKAIDASRTYAYDNTEVLGKRQEEAIIREALVRDMIRRVLRTLNAASDGVTST